MGLLDGKAMRTALARLEKAGVAPPGEVPVDFDTAATPGNVRGAPILLLTNAALYGGYMDRLGGARLRLSDVGEIVISETTRAVHYQVWSRDGRSFADLTFRSPRSGLREQMKRLAASAPGLPGRRPAAELLGAEPLAHVPVDLVRLSSAGRAELREPEPAALFATEQGLAVCTPSGGLVFSAPWAAVTTAACADVSKASPTQDATMAVELATATQRVALLMEAFGLFGPTESDEFFMAPKVKAHVSLAFVSRPDLGGSLFLGELIP